MKLPNMLPFRSCLLLATTLWSLSATADDLAQSLCSTENTGADYQGVHNIYQSLGSCFDQCRDSYAFAIVQWQWCWCSNYFPASQVSVGSCNENCPGYPKEQCGNVNAGLYGYIQLSQEPSGTAGAPSSTSTSSQTPSSSPSSSSDQEPVTSYVSTTIVQTVTPSPTESVFTSFVTPTPSTTQTTPTTTSTLTPVTSVIIETLSGAVVTQTVTTTPISAVGSLSGSENSGTRNQHLSAGAVAGLVIGVLAGVAILGLAGFLLWRRRRNAQVSENPASGTTNRRPTRNISVLSNSGLLNRNGPSMGERDHDDHFLPNPTGSNSVRHSILYSGADGVAPTSPLDSSSNSNPSSRGGHKQMVYDQRLNPSALFANHEANGSRISMQDQQDYSRPLGIANPDPRASFESRNSHG